MIRESISEAQRPEGGNIKHDISVAVARIPEFLERANAAVEKLCPGARPLPIGHFGDGNVHYNIAKPVGMDDKTFLAKWDTIMSAVHDVVAAMNGSISAEHGIGFMKREELLRLKDPSRTRPDAPDQGRARSEGPAQSGEGALKGRRPKKKSRDDARLER